MWAEIQTSPTSYCVKHPWILFSAKIFRYKCYIKSNVMLLAERPCLLIKLPSVLGSLGFDSTANEMILDAHAKATSFIFDRDHQLLTLSYHNFKGN